MRAALFLLGLLAAVPAHAQPKLLQAHASGAAPYVGPVDVVASPYIALTLRCPSLALATGSTNVVQYRNGTSNSLQDGVCLSSGAFDAASAATFAGTDATASCTIAGTSAACTGASATIHVNDPVSGVGIAGGCVVSATNGSTTATVNLAGTTTSCGTVAVAETVTFQVPLFVKTWYDNSGNTLNCVQNTNANQPQLLLTGGPNTGQPAWVWFKTGASAQCTSTTAAQSQPLTYSAVSVRTVVSAQSDLTQWSSGSNLDIFYGATGVIQAYACCIAPLNANQTEGVWHAFLSNFAGGSSILWVDNVSTPGSIGGAGTTTTFIIGTGTLDGGVSEVLVWLSTIGATPVGTLCHNQMPGAC